MVHQELNVVNCVVLILYVMGTSEKRLLLCFSSMNTHKYHKIFNEIFLDYHLFADERRIKSERYTQYFLK